MKQNLLYFLFFLGVFGFAQNDGAEFEKMVEAERKSASSIQAFVANANIVYYYIIY